MTSTPPETGPRLSGQQLRDLPALRRSTDHRMVAGVAEGLSRHLDIDPVIIRVVFAALSLFGGAGLILYAAGWLTIPADNQHHSILSGRGNHDPERVMTGGLVIGAALAALSLFGTIGWAAPHPGPVVIVAVLALAAVVLLSRRRDDRTGASWSPPPPAEAAGTSGAAQPAPGASTGGTLTGPTAPPGWSQPAADSDGGGVGPGEPTAVIPPLPPVPPRRKRPRSHLFAATMGLTAIALGVIWFVDVTTPSDVQPSVYPGVALAIIALGLVVGTWYGRSRGLIAVGLLAALLTAGFAIVGPGPYGERIYRPTAVAQLHDSYYVGAGHLVLHLEDLRDVSALAGQTISLRARVGQLKVIVPSSVHVVIRGHVDHGEIVGVAGVERLGQGEARALVVPAGGASPDLTLDLKVDFGQIAIKQLPCTSTPSRIGASNAPACH